MANVKSQPQPVPAPKPPVDEKWAQQIRLACVQAVMARVVASQAAYTVEPVIDAAGKLARFVVNGD